MRITNWVKFNEGVSENFTEEMAQEIVYCFSENSNLSGLIGKLLDYFDESFNKENLDPEEFIMYETGYDEMKEMVKKLYNFVQTGSLSFRDDMIQLYHEIRKAKEKFPEVFEIEDLFLTFIESNNFNFYLDYVKSSQGSDMLYKIRLISEYGKNYTMSDFNKFCNLIDFSLKRFSHPTCKIFISECNYYYLNNNTTSIKFEIIIK